MTWSIARWRQTVERSILTLLVLFFVSLDLADLSGFPHPQITMVCRGPVTRRHCSNIPNDLVLMVASADHSALQQLQRDCAAAVRVLCMEGAELV